jgi:uncharacterized Zn finger protein (UPF0148 family)
MSEFDKEAEREKLRKQFAEDERKRETTQRMSELLLKGATMTNAHCDTCGDPIFRWQDEQFCPTCSAAEGERVQQQAQSRAEGTSTADETTDAAPSTTASDGVRSDATREPADPAPRPESTGEGVDVPLEGEESTDEEDAIDAAAVGADSPAAPPSDAADSPAAPPSDAADSPAAPPSTPSERTREPDRASADPAPARTEPSTAPAAADRSPDSDPSTAPAEPESGALADLSEARESLGRTVTRFAREAESSDDLARAREHLAAVEDAADALAAVRRAER